MIIFSVSSTESKELKLISSAALPPTEDPSEESKVLANELVLDNTVDLIRPCTSKQASEDDVNDPVDKSMVLEYRRVMEKQEELLKTKDSINTEIELEGDENLDKNLDEKQTNVDRNKSSKNTFTIRYLCVFCISKV